MLLFFSTPHNNTTNKSRQNRDIAFFAYCQHPSHCQCRDAVHFFHPLHSGSLRPYSHVMLPDVGRCWISMKLVSRSCIFLLNVAKHSINKTFLLVFKCLCSNSPPVNVLHKWCFNKSHSGVGRKEQRGMRRKGQGPKGRTGKGQSSSAKGWEGGYMSTDFQSSLSRH